MKSYSETDEETIKTWQYTDIYQSSIYEEEQL